MIRQFARLSRSRVWRCSAVLFGLAVAVPLVGSAIELDESGARATERAVRLRPEVVDIVSIYNSGDLKSDTEAKAIAAAQQAGSDFTIRNSASIAMQRITRGGATVQSAPPLMSLPMGTTVLDADVVGALMGDEVSAVLSAESIVMSSGTAALRGAQGGDTITLRTSYGSEIDFAIGAVVDDAVTGGTELLITPEAAARLQLNRKSGVVLWGFDSREVIDQALADQGLVSNSIRIRRSWDPFDPDFTLGMGRTKELLGEFGYRVNSNGSVSQEAAWQAANLPSSRVLLNASIPIKARCHNVIEPALKAALAEAAAAGVGGVFNVFHANTAGGCHVPRFNRLAQNSTIGFLSRHSWGMALDTNTIGSCQGCAPPDFATNAGGCTAVRIFRKHGFAWGGNFLTPDGMHFEYVGERRDLYPYPSRYCPNIVSGELVDSEAATAAAVATQRATIFEDAGLVAE